MLTYKNFSVIFNKIIVLNCSDKIVVIDIGKTTYKICDIEIKEHERV